MITPKQLTDLAEKAFFKLVSARLKGENPFPWTVRSDKKLSGTGFRLVQSEILPLHEQSKAVRHKGYSVDWQERKIDGVRQDIPVRIYFEAFEDFLFYVRKEAAFESIEQVYRLTTAKYPELALWLADRPDIILDKLDLWPGLLEVCDYLFNHPPPHRYYIRELPVHVHSKFIQQNAAFLKKMLDKILPSEYIDIGESDFAGRYFLKKVQVYTQIRILDEKLKPHLGYNDIGLPLEDAAWLTWTPQKVFIIENEACFLSFPPVRGGVAIWGEGFKSRLTKHIPWLEKTELYCWFDMDTAGFQMLNMIRQYYPAARSFLMDRQTYEQFKEHRVAIDARYKKTPLLMEIEQQFYEYLYANGIRLEQEFIQQVYVGDAVRKLGY
jgi:hypothetical protein